MSRRSGQVRLPSTVLAMLLGALPVASPPTPADEVIDGNTLVVEGQPMRLFGIDAFEPGQTCLDRRGVPWHCGTAAKAALAELIQGEAVACTVIDDEAKDGYVARCTGRDGIDLGGYLVHAGLALADPKAGKDYMADQAAAKAAAAGAWGGTFSPPWEWRSQQHAK